MSDKLRTFALVTALFDKNKSIIGTFVPFIALILERNRQKRITLIQEQVHAKYSVMVPTHVLQTILKHGRKQELFNVNHSNQLWSLSTQGEEYSDSLESEDEVNRRISSLLTDVCEFFKKTGHSKSTENMYSFISEIAQENTGILEAYLRPNNTPFKMLRNGSEDRNILMKYLEIASLEHFNTIKDVIYGSLLVGVIHSDDPTILSELQDQHFRNTIIYMDTNYLLALFGFKSQDLVRPAKELYSLVCDFGLRPKVFDFTIFEFSSVLKNCIPEFSSSPVKVACSELGADLRRIGMTRSKLVKFIAEIEKHLKDLGIGVVITGIGNLTKYTPSNKEIEEAVSSAKPEQNLAPRHHDIAAVEHVRAYRQNIVRSIENVDCFFLTSDERLANGIQIHLGHSSSGSVSEVILDRLLTNILWIKKPDWRFPLESVIAAHSRILFIHRSVWDKFLDVLHDMRESGVVEEEDITSLFYQDYMENVMFSDPDIKLDCIDRTFIDHHVEVANRKRQADIARMNQEIANSKAATLAMEKYFTASVDKAKVETDTAWLNKIQNIRENASYDGKKWGNKLYNILAWISTFVIGAIAILGYSWLEEKKIIGIILFVLGVVGMVMRFLAPKFGIKSTLINWFSQLRYSKLTKGLDEI